MTYLKAEHRGTLGLIPFYDEFAVDTAWDSETYRALDFDEEADFSIVESEGPVPIPTVKADWEFRLGGLGNTAWKLSSEVALASTEEFQTVTLSSDSDIVFSDGFPTELRGDICSSFLLSCEDGRATSESHNEISIAVGLGCIMGEDCTVNLNAEGHINDLDSSFDSSLKFGAIAECLENYADCHLTVKYAFDCEVTGYKGRGSLTANARKKAFNLTIKHNGKLVTRTMLIPKGDDFVGIDINTLPAERSNVKFFEIRHKYKTNPVFQVIRFPTIFQAEAIGNAAVEWAMPFVMRAGKFAGSTEDIPNFVYGLVYIDQVFGAFADNWNVWPIIEATGFSSELFTIPTLECCEKLQEQFPDGVALTSAALEEFFAFAAEQTAEFLASLGNDIADFRSSVNALTDEEVGRLRFEEAYAQTLAISN